MVIRSERLPRVRYLTATDAASPDDVVLDGTLGPTGLALRVFKALQLVETGSLKAPFADYVAFDFETTDNDSATCDVVDIGAVRDYAQVMASADVRAMGLFQPVGDGMGGTVELPGLPCTFADA